MRVVSTWEYKQNLAGISKLTGNDVLHIYDVFDQQYLNWILTKGNPKYIVNDHITWFDNIKLYSLPLFIEKQTKFITNGIQFTNEIKTSNCFNFIINKKGINRFLCIKFVELFKLHDFDYTWSAVDRTFDMNIIIDELNALTKLILTPEEKSFILAPIKLEKRFIEFPGQKINNSSIGNYGGNAWTWKNGLQDIFLNSAISLITETVNYQRASVFTEKTLYSVLGLTFPIWIGGYNQASEWRRLGFDTFDDVIDHSYQSYDTLIERCYYAFTRNLSLLSDKNTTKELRLVHKDRLFKNRELLLQNHLGKFVDQEISKFPEDLQLAMPEILKYFRRPLKD